jgi:hypothetical protein
MKTIDIIFSTLSFLFKTAGTLIGLFLVVVFGTILGHLMSALFGINPILSSIICGILLAASLYSSLTTPAKSGGYSPAAYFFLGWLIGHKD